MTDTVREEKLAEWRDILTRVLPPLLDTLLVHLENDAAAFEEVDERIVDAVQNLASVPLPAGESIDAHIHTTIISTILKIISEGFDAVERQRMH